MKSQSRLPLFQKFGVAAVAGLLAIGWSAPARAAEGEASSNSGGGGMRIAVMGIAGLTGAREGSSNPAQASGIDTSRNFGLGLGALIESPFVDAFGIEFGALYVARTFEIGNATVKFKRSVPTLMVPLDARLWLGDILSVAGGFFAAIKVGTQTDEYSIGNATVSTFGTNGDRQSPEFGMTLAATLNIATVGKSGLFLETRYNRGFTNSSKETGLEERIDDLLFMAGVRLDM